MKKEILLPSVIITPLILLVVLLSFGNQGQKMDSNMPAPEHEELRTETLQEMPKDLFSADFSFKQDDTLTSKRTVKSTDGVLHTIPLGQILGGGPEKDGIPSIDDPKFLSINEVDGFLDDADPGLSFKYGDEVRFYPFKILVWHEIVNDIYGDKKVLITYCPLCLSGIVFEPYVEGEYVEFGTSGKLWNSNLVMYDRKTDSYWSQILGEGIKGSQAGKKLNVLPFDQLRFGEWKKKYPNGKVLSKDTGAIRFYGTDPYGDYYTTPGTFFPVDKEDSRLTDKEFVLGVLVNGEAKAYVPAHVKANANSDGIVRDIFNGKTLELHYIQDLDVVRIFEVLSDSELKRINPLPSFWFSWIATHPDSELYE